MTDTISAVIQALNRVVWGAPALLLILGVGLYFSLRTRFLQVRKLGFSLGTIWHKLREKPEAGGVSPFQAVCTALAATVGTGNIAGVAGAIAIGGPGAIFWMWVGSSPGHGSQICRGGPGPSGTGNRTAREASGAGLCITSKTVW